MPAKKPTKAGWGEQLPGDILRITALADPNKSVQYLNAETLQQWSHRSAYFNGGRLLIEVLADPAIPTKPDETISIVIDSVSVNNQVGRATTIYLPPPNSLCTPKDERKPSRDARQGRLYPASCTAFTVNDGKNGCQVTAGHCFADGTDPTEQVLQADVPLSTTLLYGDRLFAIHRHPPADKQWAIDPSSVQFGYVTPSDEEYEKGDLSKGEDWAVLGTFRNPNHGQTFREFNKGQQYSLAQLDKNGRLDAKVLKKSTKIALTGYGTSPLAGEDKVIKSMDLTQQTVVATLFDSPDANHLRHRADSHGGQSGSPIILVGTDTVIGIHTNGGCDPSNAQSSNWGSTVAMAGLRKALSIPLGVCAAA
ncbi:hypothetical protein BCR44DRAFT_141509 [Catenaria anguillulae PL171]|uniref:Serine protease n=1 Tax=Catenaria anguillulae PL171 TaxID=765915 RepID=A0A1Y2HGB7_9FUNG|nr:hypothetical protein BCR44DRAFT_141509 [Catenaria anguillulae PL171]